MKFNKAIALFATLVCAAIILLGGMVALFLLEKYTGGIICALCTLGCVYGAAGLGGSEDI